MEDNEDLDFVASEHDRLVSAITKLDKTQHITEPTRNEPTNQNSEFSLIKRSSRLKLDNVVKALEDTAHNVQIGKKLKKSQDVSKVLPKPLERPQAERIKRSTGYDQTKKKVGRWDPVVARNRTVDFVSFPIKHFPSKLQQTNDFLSKLKLKSPLEKQLEEIDPSPEKEPEEEEEAIYPMSYEEMLEHRQQMAKFRAQQSYKAAKAKRQSKIKSKKYHRILKKEKLKQQLKEFEELQSKNPEEALKKLEELEKARALERHTLRHKNTGKWAKSKLVRAKYDKEVRQQLAEQLTVSKSLTTKTQNTDSTDEEADDTENIPDITLSQDPMNPWMMKRSDKSNIDEDFNFGYKKFLKDKMYKKNEDNESDSDQENFEISPGNDETNLSMGILKESLKKLINANDLNGSCIKEEQTRECKRKGKDTVSKNRTINDTTKISSHKQHTRAKSAKMRNKFGEAIATSNWIVDKVNTCNDKNTVIISEDISTAFDNFENKVVGKVEKKLNKLRKEIDRLDKSSRSKESKSDQKTDEIDNLEYLKMKRKNIKPVIDEELIETHKDVKAVKDKEISISNIILSNEIDPKANILNNPNENIDPSRFIEIKPKYLNTVKSNAESQFDDLDDEEQVVPKVDIEEVFEEDDVVASFRQEKEDEINKDTPQDINLLLPGWGNWGGKGVKPPKRKRNRFIIKAPPKVRRRDENKGNVIINEYKNPKLAVHKVSDIPFPFNSVKEYEASVRTPLGNTFIPETAHKKLIRPSVISKAGAVIEPMDEDELLLQKNYTFKNESVIKILAKK